MPKAKSDKDRKDTVIMLRVTVGERRKLARLKRVTGLTYSQIIRIRVFGQLVPNLVEMPEWWYKGQSGTWKGGKAAKADG